MAYGFRDFSPWSAGAKAETSRKVNCLIYGSKEAESRERARDKGVRDPM